MPLEEAAGQPTQPRHPVARVVLVWAAVAALWVLADQITKILAVVLLEDAGRVVDLGIIQLRTIRNPGGAFGLPGLPGLFVVVSAVVLFLVIRALPRTERLDLAVAYGLVTGGAVGNLVDRLFRVPGFPSGAVVDFLDLRWWPVFNIADAGIVIGAIAIAVLMTRIDRAKRVAEEGQTANPPVQPDAANPPR